MEVGRPADSAEYEACSIANSPETETSTEKLQCASSMAVPTPASLHRAMAGTGQPIAEDIRRPIENRLRHDFSRVRIHSDPASSRAARDLSASAFTSGSDIFVRSKSDLGNKGLIAHELTHVAQQSTRPGSSPPLIQRQEVPAGAPSESESAPPLPAEPIAAPEAAAIAHEELVDPAPIPTIAASVGVKGKNRPADVRIMQDRLVDLGFLSPEAAASEQPSVVTPEGTPLEKVADANLSQTIAAIKDFQALLGYHDGNVGPTGPTWRSLSTIDDAGVAELREAARKKKEADERARLDEEAKKRQEEAKAELEQQRPGVAYNLLHSYGTYVPYVEYCVNLDEDGLGSALRSYTESDPQVIILVLSQLDATDAGQVASSLMDGLTEDTLGKMNIETLQVLKGYLLEVEDATQAGRIEFILTENEEAKRSAYSKLWDENAREFVTPEITGETLEDRVKSIHTAYDKYFVARTTNCFQSTKKALNKMSWDLGGGNENYIKGAIGDKGLTQAQRIELYNALVAEIEAGHPVAIGVDYKAGHPGNTDEITDHWFYIVAKTVDDNGNVVFVAYDNANVADSKITDGNIVIMKVDELQQVYHDPYWEKSTNPFSKNKTVVVNFRPAKTMPKP